MSPEAAESHPPPGHDPDATRRQRFGLILAIGVGSIAGGFSYFGTRDVWETGDRPPSAAVAAPSVVATDPAWDLDIPEGPYRADFQTSCVICHSSRLPLSQPPFQKEKWVEVVHKMVDAYGAPMTPEEESHVVDYLLAARPPGH
jgi:mono/diheme cytochrome c family protein